MVKRKMRAYLHVWLWTAMFLTFWAQSAAFSVLPFSVDISRETSLFERLRTAKCQDSRTSVRLAATKHRGFRKANLQMSSTTRLPSLDASSHVVYLRDIASVPHPEDFQPQLELLLRILTGTKGCTMLPPSDRRGLHPLVVPLARDPSDNTVIGLLRQPLKPQLDLPVVRAGAKGLDLLAPSVELFIRRAAIVAVLLVPHCTHICSRMQPLARRCTYRGSDILAHSSPPAPTHPSQTPTIVSGFLAI